MQQIIEGHRPQVLALKGSPLKSNDLLSQMSTVDCYYYCLVIIASHYDRNFLDIGRLLVYVVHVVMAELVKVPL